MLHRISWENYLLTIGLGLLIWYVAIIFIYYSKEIRQVVRSKNLSFWKKQQLSFYTNTSMINNAESNDPFSQAHLLKSLLAKAIEQAFSQQFSKEELAMAIQVLLRQYPLLQHTAFQVAIHHYIVQESQQRCSIQLSEEELGRLWD